MSRNILVLDMSNILYKTFYVNSTEPDMDMLVKLAYNASFMTLNKYFRVYAPTRVVFVFDRANWRAEYTRSEECYSKRVYKGHRRQKMTPSQQAVYDVFKTFVNEFEVMIRELTTITCLAADGLEADDLIAGVCRIYGGNDTAVDNQSTITHSIDGYKVIVVSADKDMIQLLRYDRVELIDPANGKNRTVENSGFESVDYYLYEKYIRGDRGDNVASALPRCRKTKIVEAFNDSYTHVNLMQTEWLNPEDQMVVVGEMVNENKLLMNLTHQPDHIQQLMWETIDIEFNKPRKFDHFKFLRFLGKYELKNISRYLDNYIPMLSLKI